MDISTTHMSHIETGNTKLSLQVLVALAEALEVRTDDLLFDASAAGHTAAVEELSRELKDCTPRQLRFLQELIAGAKLSMKKHLD